MEFTDVLLNQPVVIDNGSGLIKAGFAGTEQPSTVFSSCVGRPKHLRVMAGGAEGEHFIGRNIHDMRGLLKLKYPMEHGIVNHWDDMERIWSHIYNSELKILSEEHPVLLTEAPLNPRKNRDIAAQIFFETFNVPALYVSIQAVLSLYASGRVTGVVLDSGDGVTHSVPVYDGFAVTNAIQRVDIAGRDVTSYLQVLLRKSCGVFLATSAELEIVRMIKEKCCFLSPGGTNYLSTYGIGTALGDSRVDDEEFALPDGNIIRLGAERYLAPEILFSPDIFGLEYQGIHEMLTSSIQKVDLDLRRVLYANILLSGGTTLTRGFGDRLLQECKKIATQSNRDVKIKIFAPPERKYSTWIGASILASLGTFSIPYLIAKSRVLPLEKLWVSAEEYQEDPDIIHRKMF